MLRRGTAKDSNYDIGDEAIQASELSKLQRQLRVMENDRKAYAEESNNILRKKEAETAALLKENLEIRTVLKLAQSDKNESIDIDNMMKLVELVDSLDNYNKEIQDEVAMTADLEKQIMKAQEEITKQRRLSGGSTEEMCEMAIQKKIRVMENRLDKAMIKFNQQLAVNGNLRQEIDHLRQERAVFDGLFRALTTDLETIKYQMDEVISEAAQAYEERDEAQNKMLALKERSEKDINQHETEMKDLQRIISHDNKLKEFMMVKSHDRADYKEEEDAKKNKNTKDKNTDAEKEQITTCEQAFKLITDVTGDLEIEEIVENFIKKENENFALFNYVNELNGEVEQLHEDILRIHKEITDFQKDDVKMEETRKNIMSELETKSEITSRQTQAALERIGQINEVLDDLKVGVANLFDTINCDSSTIQSLLGSEENVSDKNILKYMGIIEQKTMELLQMQQYIQMKKTPPKPEKKDKKNEPAPPLQTRTDIPPPISIVPPATGDDLLEFIDEMDVRPLTQEELRSMASTNIYRRQNKIPSVPTTQLNKRSKSPRP